MAKNSGFLPNGLVAVSCHALMDEAISIARELKDWNGLALALIWAADLAVGERRLRGAIGILTYISEDAILLCSLF
jgi:hypothetical protein